MKSTMFPITQTLAKYSGTPESEQYSAPVPDGPDVPDVPDVPESISDSLEYVYVNDPKDGNDSSAESNRENQENNKNRENGENMDSNYSLSKTCNKEKTDVTQKSSDEDEEYFKFPWRLLPSKVLDDIELYKNADNKLQEELLKTTQLVYINQDGKGMVPKLREPRSLYAVAKELGPQQAARWPADIQVVHERVKHIFYTPQEREPVYKQTGLEKCPMVRGEERGGRLVYMYEPRSTFFVRSRVGGLRSGPEKVAVNLDRNTDDTTLIFESRFESGNLAKAIQVGEFEYELWLRYDLYTSKHTQWFYFSVSNTRPNQVYRFSIVNFMKPDSLYNYGMKPLLYSEKDALQKKIGWRRAGLSVKYYKNNSKYETARGGEKSFYSMTWTTEFPQKNDTVYFSHCFPYTYTDLQDYLLDLSNDPVKSKICKQRVLCRTLAGNLVYVLTITSPSQNPEDIKHKKAVVLTSRVHPGESNASWMMKGFLDYLTSDSADAKLLRDTFIFKIVPMLNPDGVIVGNYRCSLAGRDLNRNYKTVLKDSYPTVWHTKQMIRRLLQERDIVLYCDLHGHSRRQNVFIYGCENRHNPQRRLRERIFPCMLSKNSPEKFAFDSCKFKVQRSKEGTGRIVMWNMGIMNSFTMEATFCGSSMGKMKGFHFSAADFEVMGYDFCDTLLDYCDPDATKCGNVLYDLEEKIRGEIRRRLEQKGVNTSDMDIDLDDEYTSGMESSDGGSDSSVSDGPPVHLQFAQQREDKGTTMEDLASKKKKKLKTKKERDKTRKDETANAKKPERPATEGPLERKALSGHQTAHARQDKLTTQSMRYTQASPKRPKSSTVVDERTTSARQNSARERTADENLQKRPRKLLEPAKCDAEDTKAIAVSMSNLVPSEARTDYLEALTSAYLRNGILNDELSYDRCPLTTYEIQTGSLVAGRNQGRAAPHFRYSGNSNKYANMPLTMEGLCPHHEQAFAVQLMSQRMQNMSGACCSANVLNEGIRGETKKIKPFQQKNQDELVAKILGMPTVVGNSFVRVWKDYIQKNKSPPKLQQVPLPITSLDEMNLEELMKGSEGQGSDRRPQHRHLLEVSAAQQRQQDILGQGKRGDKSASKTIPSPFDDKDKMGMSTRLRAQVPSATFVNYDTFKISQLPAPDGQDSARQEGEDDDKHSHCTSEDHLREHNTGHRHKNGRKSRMAMHDSENEEEDFTRRADGPDYVHDPHGHRHPRVKSAKNEGDLNNAIQSIRDLRQSLATSAAQSNLSPTAGNYIKKLLKHELKQADEDIGEITSKLQHNIDEKQKHYNVMLERQDSSARSRASSSRSEVRPQTSQSQGRKSQNVFHLTTEASSLKVELAATAIKPERSPSASTSRQGSEHSASTTTISNNNKPRKEASTKKFDKQNVNTSATANALASVSRVEAYHATPPHSKTPHSYETSDFKQSQIQNFDSVEKYPPHDEPPLSPQNNNPPNSSQGRSNQNGGIFNKVKSFATSASDHGTPRLNGTESVPANFRNQSASSGSSREETWSGNVQEKKVTKPEVVPRVKSAKNNSRQIIETVPTRISLMITQDHDERYCTGGQFLPMSRSVRGPQYNKPTLNPKRK